MIGVADTCFPFSSVVVGRVSAQVNFERWSPFVQNNPHVQNNKILSEYLSREQLAEEIHKSVRTLERWEELRIGPPVTRLGRDPYYSIVSVRKWLANSETPMVRQRRGTK